MATVIETKIWLWYVNLYFGWTRKEDGIL